MDMSQNQAFGIENVKTAETIAICYLNGINPGIFKIIYESNRWKHKQSKISWKI